MGWNRVAGHLACGRDDLTNRVARAVAQIEPQALLIQGGEGQEVGLGQIGDVDVIADTGAVGRLVVAAEDALKE